MAGRKIYIAKERIRQEHAIAGTRIFQTVREKVFIDIPLMQRSNFQ